MTNHISKVFSENLLILDDHPWLKNLISKCFYDLDKLFIQLPSSISMRESLTRIQNADRVIIHWEGNHRLGGSILEELIELDPKFDLRERVLVITTNPAREDVYYFRELGLERIIRVEHSKLKIQSTVMDIKKHLTNSIASKPNEESWRRIHGALDQLNSSSTPKHFESIEKAIGIMQKRSKDSNSATILDAKATLAFYKGDKVKAENYWKQAIDRNPNFHRAYCNLTNFYEKEQNFEPALKLIQKLNEKNKNSISRMVQLGRVHRNANEVAKAEHYYCLALEKDRYCNRALNGLAEIRFDQGEYNEARELLNRSQNSNKTASYLNRKGIDLVRKNKFEEALQLYKNAQFVLPDQDKGPLLFYNIGLCYSRWGKYKMAQQYLKLALIKKPDYKKAETLLERIESNA